MLAMLFRFIPKFPMCCVKSCGVSLELPKASLCTSSQDYGSKDDWFTSSCGYSGLMFVELFKLTMLPRRRARGGYFLSFWLGFILIVWTESWPTDWSRPIYRESIDSALDKSRAWVLLRSFLLFFIMITGFWLRSAEISSSDESIEAFPCLLMSFNAVIKG